MLAPQRLLLSALLILTACDDAPSSALGIGRAPAGGQTPVPLLPVMLSRLYAPTTLPAGATAFVEMRLASTSPDLNLQETPLYLITHAGMVALPGTTWVSGTALRVDADALAPLNVRTGAGELAVVDAMLNVHAYSAWGVLPANWSQSFVAVAQARGLLPQVEKEALPYPLDANVAINLDPNAASACISADPNADSTSGAAAAACASSTVAVQISRVQPAGLDTQAGYIEIHNGGPDVIDVHGLTLCIDALCGPIEAQNPNTDDTGPAQGRLSVASSPAGGNGSLDASRAIVAIGAAALTGVDVETDLRAPRPGPLTAQSEVALFAPGYDLHGTASVALAYLRFGATAADANALPLLQAAQSAEATAWRDQGLAPPRLFGETQTRDVSLPASDDPAAWSLSSSTPLTVVTDLATNWTSCSQPRTPAAPDALRIVEVAQGAARRIILRNTGAEALDLSPYSLTLGGEPFLLNAYTAPLSPGAALWIELQDPNSGGCTVNQDLCWPGAQTDLTYGVLSLVSAGTPVGFLQWGTPSPDAAATQAAVTENLWPKADCTVDGFVFTQSSAAPEQAIRLFDSASGQSPADYFLGVPSRP